MALEVELYSIERTDHGSGNCGSVADASSRVIVATVTPFNISTVERIQ